MGGGGLKHICLILFGLENGGGGGRNGDGDGDGGQFLYCVC